MDDPAAPPPKGPTQGPNCFQCRHFAVSWDPSLPYACRLMGFKSRVLPAIEVLRVDGVFCRGHSPKPSLDLAKAPAAPSASVPRSTPASPASSARPAKGSPSAASVRPAKGAPWYC